MRKKKLINKNQRSFFFEDYKNKVIKAKSLEISKNPPSRSGKLRFAIRNNEIFKNSSDLIEKFKSYIELEMTNVKK